MTEIHVNLKRFDIPRHSGGICPGDDPIAWIRSIINRSVELGLGQIPDLHLNYLLPEGLVSSAVDVLRNVPSGDVGRITVGVQSVYRDDVRPGGNFGAFTGNLPASAVDMELAGDLIYLAFGNSGWCGHSESHIV